MIARIFVICSALTFTQIVANEKIKLNTLLITNLGHLLRSNSEYNFDAHTFQIIPLEMRMVSYQNPRPKTNRKLDDDGTKSEMFYEIALPKQRIPKHPPKNEDQLEGIVLPFTMPVGGFFGRK